MEYETVPNVSKQEFAQVAEELDDVLRQAEKKFRDFGIGSRGSVLIRQEVLSTGQTTISFCFGRHQDRWQFFLEKCSDGTSDIQSLWSAPIDDRANAIRVLPQLLDSMRANREVRLRELKKTVESGRAFLQTLGFRLDRPEILPSFAGETSGPVPRCSNNESVEQRLPVSGKH